MNRIKLLFLSLLISLTTLSSCTNNETVDLVAPQDSIALQYSLESLKTHYNEDGTLNGNLNPSENLLFDFCFKFVYPIQLIYNNGSTVIANNIEELILILINSTSELYIVGIEFPFNVEVFNPETNEVDVITITNESEFADLLVSCNFGDPNPCNCDGELNPVCVEILENNQVVIITFVNECYALCEGFTQNDFINCENNGNCNISNLEVILDQCNEDGTYPLTINFDYENVGNQVFFDLFVRNEESIGYFSLADLPLTLENFELSGEVNDYIKVCINDNSNCCEEIEWNAPNCDDSGDDCYKFVFPITMFLGGEEVIVSSNQDVDYYLELGYDLQYPINITVNNKIITVMQGILEGGYGERCD